ncbi:MAG TPA: peptidase M48, partial [Phaeodactylibacter sp.]|nr:peptidase M48 [Phaeodactylibacter sp.]
MMTVPSGCNVKGGQGINLFTIEQEQELGRQVKQEIESNPSEYPLLPEQGNEQVYQYIRSLRDYILNSGQLAHRNDFAWEVKIIKDDETLNAFCTPGGYIYVYSGLIKFLDNESELLGVLAH